MLKSVILLLFSCFLMAGKHPGSSMVDVLSAIRKGDAGQLSRHLDEVVRLTLDDRTHPYSKTQSEAILRNFFKSRTILDLAVVHQSDGEDGEIFVGDLRSDKGRHRVSIIMRTRGDRLVISELRLERP